MIAHNTIIQTEKDLQPTSYTEQYSDVDGKSQVFLENFGGKKSKKSRPKKGTISPERNREIYLADKFEQKLSSNFLLSPIDAAKEYYSAFPTVPAKANRFWKWTEQGRDAHAGFHKRSQPFRKMFERWFDPYFYTLALSDLPVTPKIEKMLDRERIFNPQVDLSDIRQVYRNSHILKALAREHFDGALLVKIESNLEVPHIHCVAERNAGLLHLRRLEPKQKGKCTPVYEPVGLMTYLLKPTFHIDAESPFDPEEAVVKLALVIEAKRDFYQDHYQQVVTAYQKSSENKPGKKFPAWVAERGRAYAKLPNMRDFFPADSMVFA